MATFSPGTGGSLKSVTYEDALAEILVRMQNLETEQSVNRITYALNPVNGTFDFSGSLPYEAVLNQDNGKLVIEVTEYLSNPQET